MKKYLYFFFKFLLFVVFIVVAVFVYLTITDYKPKATDEIYTSKNDTLINKTEFKVLIWNIGYAGLGDDMDFFYDGGTKVRTSKERTLQNIKSISLELSKHTDADFIMLQEVDINAKRSYEINNLDTIKEVLANYYDFYVPNYRVKYVPIPITEPMGKVESGLVTFSKYEPISVKRFAFKGNFSWPKSLFMLDRCFMVARYNLDSNKQLLIINTHNSAFDDGTLKAQQLQQISDFVMTEYNKGNYIILGGDWNQNPPNFTDNILGKHNNSKATFKISQISNNFLPDWNIFYDVKVPSNRFLTEPYKKGKTKLTILDMYLCSPNIAKIKIKTLNLDFKNSDHNPVILQFKLQ